ncbi:toll-like receptor 2 [Ornithodoros turicata]|uniref:toll-like receptor 2 n=1 Tax=Ornithodoros turicata TaxID=34597 RepID=UPI00313891D2
MPQALLPSHELWWLPILLAIGSASASFKVKMPSRNWVHRVDEIYLPPQYTVTLSMGVGPALSTRLITNCSVSHHGDGGLVISGHKCTRVPKVNTNILGGPPLAIAVYHTSITYLTPRSFTSYSPTEHITKVEIIQNKITTVESHAFQDLSNVTFLSLTDNPIRFLYSESFAGLVNLKELILFRTRITEIASIIRAIVPRFVPNLEILNLGSTPIWRITETDFAPLANSTIKHVQLHLCDNLTYVHPKAFRYFKYLEGVYFRDNLNMSQQNLQDAISNITQETFKIIDISQTEFYKGMPYDVLRAVAQTSAEVVIITRSTRGVISKKDFPLMSKVKYLLMPATKIKVFRPDAFDNLPNLEGLAFDRNQFPVVPLGVLIPRLKVLDLSGYDRGLIQLDLGEGILGKMTNLRELLMRYRALPSFTANTFRGLKKLEYLNIKKCSIDSLPEGVFSPLKSLRYLDLSENPIFSTSTGSARVVLHSMYHLHTLLLSQTELTDIHTSIALGDMPGLTALDISNNSISAIAAATFGNNPLLEHLDLSLNKLEDWTVKNESSPSLRVLDLSFNEFQAFSTDALNSLSSLSWLDLSMNPYRCSCNLRPFLSWLRNTNVTVHTLAYAELYRCSTPRQFSLRYIMSTEASLLKLCQPSVIIIIACVGLLLLVFAALLVGGLIYKRRFKSWLKNPPSVSMTAKKTYLYDAFVSYSNNDTAWVFNVLLPHLESSAIGNLKLCVYDRDFVAGKNISECILDSIKHSRKIVLVLSNSFLQSPWCRFETDLAQYTLLEENRDAIILLKLGALDERLISPKLNYLLRTRIHLVWSESPKEECVFFTKLRRAIDGTRSSLLEKLPKKSKLTLFAFVKHKTGWGLTNGIV